MANGSVYDKIIAQGQEDASAILEAGHEKANNITEQMKNLVNEKIEQMISDAKTKNEDLVKTKVAELEQNKKQNVLANQKRLIKEAFNVALNKLVSMDDENLSKFVLSYLLKSQLQEDVVIKVNYNELNRYKKLFSSNNSNDLDILSSQFNHHVELSNETHNSQGGFIIEGPYFDIDNTYLVVLEGLSNTLETKVAEILFKSEE